MKPPLKTVTICSSLVLLFMVITLSGCDHKQGVKTGDRPPGFSDTDIKGEFVSLSQLKGKVVVLYFWADTCCGNTLKQVEPFYSRNRFRGLEIVAINMRDQKTVVQAYAKANGITFTMLTDDRALISRQYAIIGLPTIFIIDRSGIIREKILGDVQSARLEKLVSQYLETAPS